MSSSPDRPRPSRNLSSGLAASLVFLSSGAVLVLEILALRLVAPYVGISLETSTAVIGFALAAIATGAWLGGKAADAVPPARLLGPAVMVAGVLVLFVGPTVRFSGEQLRGGQVPGILLLAAVAVFAPAALLSAITPMVVKLRLGALAETGRVVGRLSGIGTLGALVATFGTGFLLVSAAPTSAILLILGAVLVVLGVALTLMLRGFGPAVGPAVFAFLGAGSLLLAPEPCEVETAYHCANIVPDGIRPAGRTLQLDTLSHSYVDLSDPTYLEFSYIRGIASVIDTVWPAGQGLEALHIGGGGFTLPRYLRATRPATRSLVLEIDRGVVELDQERLGLKLDNRLQVDVGDARTALSRLPEDSRDIIVGDAFGGLSVPWHLTTRETIENIRRILRPAGVYTVNVIDYPPLGFARAEVRTLASVFEHSSVIARPAVLGGTEGGNLVLVGSDRPLPVAEIAEELQRRAPELSLVSGKNQIEEFWSDAPLLTDDFAPVDQLLSPYDG